MKVRKTCFENETSNSSFNFVDNFVTKSLSTKAVPEAFRGGILCNIRVAMHHVPPWLVVAYNHFPKVRTAVFFLKPFEPYNPYKGFRKSLTFKKCRFTYLHILR